MKSELKHLKPEYYTTYFKKDAAKQINLEKPTQLVLNLAIDKMSTSSPSTKLKINSENTGTNTKTQPNGEKIQNKERNAE